MVRPNRVKYYYFPGSPDLYGDGTTGSVDVYSDNPINGRIQAVYFEGGNWDPAGSVTISVSGTTGGLTTSEGNILVMASGPSTGPGAGSSTGHHLGEDWVVFPRATSVNTDGLPISSGTTIGEYTNYQEIPVWSIIRVQANSIGTGSNASGISIIYI